MRRCVELPGQELFQYVDAQSIAHGVGSSDVNAYLKEVTGSDFTAKDFRTWHATVDALELLSQCAAGSKTEARRLATAALREVASRLGNTVSVCRKAYVHPAVLECFMSGSLSQLLETGTRRLRLRGTARLPARERRVLVFLSAASEAAAGRVQAAPPARNRR